MTTALQDSLVTLAQQCTLSLQAISPVNLPQTGYSVTLRAPPAGLTVTEDIVAPAIQQCDLSLDFLVKQVRFATAAPAVSDPVGGQALPDLLIPQIQTVTTGPIGPPGVAGLVGHVTGKLPVVIDTTTPTQTAVTLEARWRIERPDGQLATDVQWAIGAGVGGNPQAGVGGEFYPAATNLMNPVIMALPFGFIEDMVPPVALVTRVIRVALRLQAGNANSDWVPLPPLTLPFPTIPIPTLAIFYQDPAWAGNHVAFVPGNSPYGQGSLFVALGALTGILQPLFNSGTFPELQLLLNELAPWLPQQLQGASIVWFGKADSMTRLDGIVLQKRRWSTKKAEDQLSSLILLGPPGRRLNVFNSRAFDSGEGVFTVTVGPELYAKVPTTHVGAPQSVPANRVTVPHPSTVQGGTFTDSISSFAFA
jgi:hypothetical protein